MSHRSEYVLPRLDFPDEHRSEIVEMLHPVNRSIESLESQARLLGEMIATLMMERNRTSLREKPELIEDLFRVIDGWEAKYKSIRSGEGPALRDESEGK